MKKKVKEVCYIILRYVILVLAGLPNLWVFYAIFAPLTTLPVYFIFSLFYDVALIGNVVNVSGYAIEIINACVAGSAYYLLLILNLSTPGIKLKKRLSLIGLSFLALLIINILRIILLGLVHISGSAWFDITHKLFWYFMSIIFVIGIWFAQVKIFKIKEIPFYSDLKFLYKHSYLKKKK